MWLPKPSEHQRRILDALRVSYTSYVCLDEVLLESAKILSLNTLPARPPYRLPHVGRLPLTEDHHSPGMQPVTNPCRHSSLPEWFVSRTSTRGRLLPLSLAFRRRPRPLQTDGLIRHGVRVTCPSIELNRIRLPHRGPDTPRASFPQTRFRRTSLDRSAEP